MSEETTTPATELTVAQWQRQERDAAKTRFNELVEATVKGQSVDRDELGNVLESLGIDGTAFHKAVDRRRFEIKRDECRQRGEQARQDKQQADAELNARKSELTDRNIELQELQTAMEDKYQEVVAAEAAVKSAESKCDRLHFAIRRHEADAEIYDRDVRRNSISVG